MTAIICFIHAATPRCPTRPCELKKSPLNRNVFSLTLALSFAMTAPAITVLFGGVIGNKLAHDPKWATLPVALMVVGGALSSSPAALLMQRFGRKRCFISAAMLAVCSGLISARSITEASFMLFCTGSFIVGINNAFVQQYRFAASESVPLEWAGKAVSLMMLGGIVAAYIGPEVATRLTESIPEQAYVGSFYGLSVLMCGAIISLSFYRDVYQDQTSSETKNEQTPRNVSYLISQPLFLTALAASTIGFGVMGFIMTVTPVSMHVHSGFSLESTATVIQSHIIAMYLPSLASAYLVTRLGYYNLMLLGAAAMIICTIVALIDQSFLHYWFALVLLGIGWNFLFIAGTTALAHSHSTAERFTAQAINDGVVFGVQALASLSAGAIMYAWGWDAVQWICLPALLALFLGVLAQKLSYAYQIAEK